MAETDARRWRVWTHALVLVLLVLTSLFVILKEARRSHRLDVRTLGLDEITLHERRMVPLRGHLPTRGIVGYLSDETDENQAAKRLYLTQYTLAPVLVERGASRPLVVGNFTQPLAARTNTRGLVVVRDFGGGLVLYRKAAF
jgi:hypothetical protein